MDGLVADLARRRNLRAQILGFGPSGCYRLENGNRDSLHRFYGMDASTILSHILREEGPSRT